MDVGSEASQVSYQVASCFAIPLLQEASSNVTVRSKATGVPNNQFEMSTPPGRARRWSWPNLFSTFA